MEELNLAVVFPAVDDVLVESLKELLPDDVAAVDGVAVGFFGTVSPAEVPVRISLAVVVPSFVAFVFGELSCDSLGVLPAAAVWFLGGVTFGSLWVFGGDLSEVVADSIRSSPISVSAWISAVTEASSSFLAEFGGTSFDLLGVFLTAIA